MSKFDLMRKELYVGSGDGNYISRTQAPFTITFRDDDFVDDSQDPFSPRNLMGLPPLKPRVFTPETI